MRPSVVLDKDYWNQRWAERATGWDIGAASPAIITFMKSIEDRHVAILIPGCGNAHEAQTLSDMGFTNITLIDIAPQAIALLQKKFKDQPQIRIIEGDFFNHEGAYDLIVEQTFFCAIDRSLRKAYAEKVRQLLKVDGRLVGLLFKTEFEKEGPPFGGSEKEYESIFCDELIIQTMETCYNSISPRHGNELFIKMRKSE